VYAGRIVGGIVLFFFGLILTATILLAFIGLPLLLIGLILIILGAVTSPPAPVIVQQAPPQVVFMPPPPPPTMGQPPVTVNVQSSPPIQAPPQIMRRCQFCGTVYPESQLKCPKCGAAF